MKVTLVRLFSCLLFGYTFFLSIPELEPDFATREVSGITDNQREGLTSRK